MKVTNRTREVLAARRERRALTRLGFRQHETDWEIHRGALYNHRIVEARISQCGKYVWTRLAPVADANPKEAI